MRAGSPPTPPGPAAFEEAVASLRATPVRAEVQLTEIPGPARLAPHTFALRGEAVAGGVDLASGRLILLHDPAGHEAWQGTFRLVTYVRAELDPETVLDPLLPGVAWTWLTEVLDGHAADYVAPSGTVTRVASESFGALANRPVVGEIEIRASWTPLGDVRDHVEAWADLLCTAAGLPPVPPGVVHIPSRRPAHDD